MKVIMKNSWKSYLTGWNKYYFQDLVHTYINNLHNAVVATNHDYRKLVTQCKSLNEFSHMTHNLATEQGNDISYQRAYYALNHVKPELWNAYTWSDLLFLSAIIKHVTLRTTHDYEINHDMNTHIDFFATNFIKASESNGMSRDDAINYVFDSIHSGNYNAKLEFNECHD